MYNLVFSIHLTFKDKFVNSTKITFLAITSVFYFIFLSFDLQLVIRESKNRNSPNPNQRPHELNPIPNAINLHC